ncbi:ABC transporter permease [Actinomadura coerulea]|uniref:ABC transporter permease n=1 Tax=Actinomadura coerulea TaxID=46159 RepID=UPI003446EADF
MSSTVSSEHGQGSVHPPGSGSRLAGEAAGGTGRRRSPLGETVGRYMVPLLFLVLTAYFAITLPNFRSSVNFVSMADAQSIVLMLAIVACFQLRIGEFDLSLVSTMVLSGALVARLTQEGQGLTTCLVAVLLTALVIGALNGFLVVVVGVDAFVTTLGVNTLVSGLIYWVTGSTAVVTVPDPIVSLARTDVLGLTSATWIGWLFVLVAWYVFDFTPLGRHLLFVGGNRDVARLAGVGVERIRFLSFVGGAIFAALIGLLLLGQLGAADPSTTNQYLLPPFAAVFLGAATIRLNQFNALGTLFALYLLGVGVTGLQLMGAPTWVSLAFNGIALVVAVTLARLAGRKAAAA